ncbi:hypothetical protein SG34_018485 [Thalassomonas viridans]|uniref:Uncharacterized protein n=1 Tax=Thalassomonas viridans TaxID=137584 RepID=A0AAE9YYQ4_9GAMM|nr:hypothetical protein [Thalassomonas viridans]WDE03378.1 hypothetical protein SG34_018485 [Thalassomonas viridans]
METVFNTLAKIMKKHAGELEITDDKPGSLYINTGKLDAKKKAIFFGMVKQAKKKVTYHLMPVYCNPELLANLSPELTKKMQGKSCFNFTAVDDKLFAELDALTQAGLADYQKAGKA